MLGIFGGFGWGLWKVEHDKNKLMKPVDSEHNHSTPISNTNKKIDN